MARRVPKKQRRTIQRIYDRLREERGFDGGYTTVRDYVHPRRLSLKEAFVPLAHLPRRATDYRPGLAKIRLSVTRWMRQIRSQALQAGQRIPDGRRQRGFC